MTLRRVLTLLTLIAAATGGVLLVLTIGFASVRAGLGKQVGAGYAGVENNLCVLDADADAGILIGGDSRAKTQINPAVLEAKTGLRSINIAEIISLGGDIATLVNSLRKYPRILESHPIILVSITMMGFNDQSVENTPMATMFNWTAPEHARIAVREPARYGKFFWTRYLPAVFREIRHIRKKDGYACDENVYRPQSLIDSKGYRPYHGRARYQQVPDTGGYVLYGARWRVFRESLDWLADSQARAVVILDAPIDPVWRRSRPDPRYMEMQTSFSKEVAEEVAEETARHPKVRFLDFISEPLQVADSTHFYDALHFDSTGADIFTAYLGDYLAREFPKGGP